jgi:hypothetical protein
MPETQLAIVIPPACIALQLVRAREYRMVVRATHGGHELPTQCLDHLGHIKGVLITMSQLPLDVKPECVHLSAIYIP